MVLTTCRSKMIRTKDIQQEIRVTDIIENPLPTEYKLIYNEKDDTKSNNKIIQSY